MAKAKIPVTKGTFALMIEKLTLLESLCAIEKKEKAIENENQTENRQNLDVDRHDNLTVNEIRLKDLKAEIKNVDVVTPERQNQVVQVGSIINLKYPTGIVTMTVDGLSYNKNVISVGSPIGLQLLGKKAGDTVLINGKTEVLIQEILLPKN